MPRTNRKKSTKTKANPSARQVITWAAILIVLVSVGLITLGSIREHTQKIRTEKAQTTRLNAAANDLQKVYDQLVATTPNIREKSFEKSCTQSSAVLNNGTIMCGGRVHLEQSSYDENSYFLLSDLVIRMATGSREFQLKSKRNGQYFATNQPASEVVLVHVDTSVSCDVSTVLYTSIQYENRFDKTMQPPKNPISTLDISCIDVVGAFLPGYTKKD